MQLLSQAGVARHTYALLRQSLWALRYGGLKGATFSRYIYQEGRRIAINYYYVRCLALVRLPVKAGAP
jgi:hypothetical protein